LCSYFQVSNGAPLGDRDSFTPPTGQEDLKLDELVNLLTHLTANWPAFHGKAAKASLGK
jgi:hypothetical protein